jgi:hypothetical protein
MTQIMDYDLTTTQGLPDISFAAHLELDCMSSPCVSVLVSSLSTGLSDKRPLHFEHQEAYYPERHRFEAY